MDLRVFYAKMRQEEAKISEPHVVVVSLDTPDGGRPGMRTEVTRETAARLIVEGRARVATSEESKEFRDGVVEAMHAAEQAAAASKAQYFMMSEADVKAIKSAARTKA
jgi:hypothetical protein